MKKILEKFSNYYIVFCIYALLGWIYEVLWMWLIVSPHKFTNRGFLFGPFLPIYGSGMIILIILLNKMHTKKHRISNPIYMFLSTTTILTFIYTTIIEYTTSPKITSVTYYLQNYGLGLFFTNIIGLGVLWFIIKTSHNQNIKKWDITIVLIFLAIWIITTLIEYVSHYVMETSANKVLWNYTKDFLNIKARVNWDASRNFAIGGTFSLYLLQPSINQLLKKLKSNQKIGIAIIIGIPMVIDFIVKICQTI